MKLNLAKLWKAAKVIYGVGVVVVPIAKKVVRAVKKRK